MKIAKILLGAALVVSASIAAEPASVKIGEQVWMKKNMDVKTPHSWCYDENPENCEKYGRLYTWEDAQTVCPVGWHLPTRDDYVTFLSYINSLESDPNASQRKWMKSDKIRSKEWNGGLDNFEFATLPAGYIEVKKKKKGLKKKFNGLNRFSAWWVDFNKDSFFSSFAVTSDEAELKENHIDGGQFGFSVRCLKGNSKQNSSNEKKYESVKIGDQVWMKKNMDVETEYSWCYDNKPENCKIYGRLYSWDDAQKVCPIGWHLPTKDDFDTLIDQDPDAKKLSDFAGRKHELGESGSTRFRSKNFKGAFGSHIGSDDYGLSILPAGYYTYDAIGMSDGVASYDNAIFDEAPQNGEYGSSFWWSSTECEGNEKRKAFEKEVFALKVNTSGVFEIESRRNKGYSVRCIKNPEEGNALEQTDVNAQANSSPVESKYGFCNESKKNEKHAFANAYYACDGKIWQKLSFLEYATFDLVCNEKNDGQKLYTKSKTAVYTCSSGSWQFALVEKNGHEVWANEYDAYVWTEENLNVPAAGSFCPENNEIYCKRYGRLYSYDAAKHVCPAGWELPSRQAVANFLKGLNEISTLGKYPGAFRNAKGQDVQSKHKSYFWLKDENGSLIAGYFVSGVSEEGTDDLDHEDIDAKAMKVTSEIMAFPVRCVMKK